MTELLQAVRQLGDGPLGQDRAGDAADADAAGELDWQVQVETSVVRAHQHNASARKDG